MRSENYLRGGLSSYMLSNNFISYLNSLHNLGAGGANALAESQALNDYFTELYEPFDIVQPLLETLRQGSKVVILTGHAGDGKSTVALDIFKQLKGLDPLAPLQAPMQKQEAIEQPAVSIVKDMSELSISERRRWITDAFEEDSKHSWLIISNTGPLLQSLTDYAEDDSNIRSNILKALGKAVNTDNFNVSDHTISGFDKDLIILNLTQLDNVRLGSKLLDKMIHHSAWAKCDVCSASTACPILHNRSALVAAGDAPAERVRWVYQRLNAYEHRLTLRQIVAHLALSITGGLGCDKTSQSFQVSDDSSDSMREYTLFSETFFGYQDGEPWPEAERLHAISLLKRELFGSPAGVEYDRIIASKKGMGWAILPEELNSVDTQWREQAGGGLALRKRYALRRMNYIFGQKQSGKEVQAQLFLNHFLISEMLIDYDEWQQQKRITLSGKDARTLEKACLTVLMETFSGYSAGQFANHDNIYLTLRRADKAIVQPTQIVLKTLPFRDFRLTYNQQHNSPALEYLSGRAVLPLSLPLLDYIRQRSLGELGSSLSPIYQSQLDAFHGALIREGQSTSYDNEINLLQTGVDGQLTLRKFFLSETNGQTILEGNS